MRQTKKFFFILTLLLIFVLTACGGSAPVTTTHQFVVEAKEFTFSPAELVVKLGETVEIELKNSGVVEHDFSIEAVPVRGEVITHGDQHDTAHALDTAANPVHVLAKVSHAGHLVFIPSQAGEYLIICTVVGHKEAGMVGKLIVTP